MNLSELKTPAEPEDLYHPVMAEIKEVKRLSAMETYFRVELPGGEDLGHVPGQFVELTNARRIVWNAQLECKPPDRFSGGGR